MTPEGAVAETVNSLREMYGADVVPEVRAALQMLGAVLRS